LRDYRIERQDNKMSDSGKVVFSGENPWLTLFRPGSDEIVTAASYWRCVYSEHGEGNALIIWADGAGSGLGDLAPKAIYTDNPGMARMVTDRFTQHFATYQNRGFDAMDPTYARFFQESDSRWYHRVSCNTGSSVVELTWWTVLNYQMALRNDYLLGPTRWDLASVVCPCRNATIQVNNHSVAGEVRVAEDGPQIGSSASLAFSETWVEKG
jgi:hypothetical protein